MYGTDNQEETLRTRAERVAGAKLKFLCSAASYALLCAFLFAIDWWTTGRITWAFWPAIGLGLALFSQGIKAWGRSNALYERMVAREMDAIRQRGEK
ncbi:2TM domain-containing protein [Chitinimonas sp.]|uniref:2TM domain-containing protein n=1 Tax=Chitinimonas sp. TaxID=1934313 RepID=UPI002F938029